MTGKKEENVEANTQESNQGQVSFEVALPDHNYNSVGSSPKKVKYLLDELQNKKRKIKNLQNQKYRANSKINSLSKQLTELKDKLCDLSDQGLSVLQTYFEGADLDLFELKKS